MDAMLERILECIGPKHGSKKELAEFLDIHPNVITNWLNGRNKSYRKYLPQISEHYNVSIEWLKGESDKKMLQPLNSELEQNEELELFMKYYVPLSTEQKKVALAQMQWLKEREDNQ